MPRIQAPRPFSVVALLVVALVLHGCAAGGAAAPPPTTVVPDRPAAGFRTVVEHGVATHPDAGGFVVEVVETPEGLSATWTAVAPPREPRLLGREVVVGDEHFVHLAVAEGVIFDRAAWIRFDTTDPDHVAFLEDNRPGMVDQRLLADTEVGEHIGDDVVRSVDEAPDGGRVLRTEAGALVTVRRTPLDAAAPVTRPDDLPIVAFEEVASLIPPGG